MLVDLYVMYREGLIIFMATWTTQVVATRVLMLQSLGRGI